MYGGPWWLRRPELAAFLLVAASTLVHLWYAGLVELSPQEAYYWAWGQRLDWSYYSKGPLVAYLIALSTRLGGDTEFWVRLPAVLLGTLTAVIGYALTHRIFRSERAAFVSLVLLSVMPLYAIGAVLMTIDAPFVCCWGLAWLCLSRVRPREGELAWYGAGAAFGLGLLSKYTMFMLVPCVVLWLISSPRLRHWLRRREPYDALVLGLLIFSPVVVWNARNDWYSLRHVLIQAGGGSGRSLLATLGGGPEFLATQFGVVSPFLFIVFVLGEVCFEALCKFTPGQQYVSATTVAFQPDICTQADDLPFKSTAGVLLAQPHDVPHKNF